MLAAAENDSEDFRYVAEMMCLREGRGPGLPMQSNHTSGTSQLLSSGHTGFGIVIDPESRQGRVGYDGTVLRPATADVGP